MNEENIIDLKNERSRFYEHISNNFNKRIVFSGAFGSGKTFFINDFFEKNSEDFIVFKMYPVNYSVTLNEDIFELIKYDILLNILNGYINEIEIDENISKLLSLQFFAINESYEILKPIIEAIPKIGKNVSTFLEVFSKIPEKFKEYDKKTRGNNSNKIETLIKKIIKQKGSIYEEDAITVLIKDLIKQIKEKNKNKQIALIIEDLDRIDPEHIFRLLNVFAAHFDIYNDDLNKFDFDKIIFVCDIENIRNIFHSKYGTEVDFTGYIDKFYSTDVFQFDNSKAIDNFISRKLLLKFKVAGETEERYVERDSDVLISIKYILKILIQANIINLRSLLKPISKGFTIHYRQIHLKDTIENHANLGHGGLIVIEYLKYLFGTLENLKTAIKKCKERRDYEAIPDKDDPKDLRKYSLLILLLYYARFEAEAKNSKMQLTVNNDNTGNYFDCEILRADRQISVRVRDYNLSQPYNKDLKKLSYFEVLYETIEYVQAMGLLK
ncbi:MAG TPA: P-loop NTPase fold protein [Bacteroidia bacterium]|nr:P-loop NTPase fold protein [Bacteroidia bacterium]